MKANLTACAGIRLGHKDNNNDRGLIVGGAWGASVTLDQKEDGDLPATATV